MPSDIKVCSHCGQKKPTSDFHKRRAAAGGLNSRCKTCACAARRAYIAENPSKLAAARKRRSPEQRQADYERTAAWRDQNRQRTRDYARDYAAAHPQETAENKHRWYLANRELVLSWPLRNPEADADRHRRYRESHRDERAERQRKRRVDKLGLRIEDVDLEELWTGSCGICSQSIDTTIRWPDPLSKSIDHILPLALGGTHEAANLQWAHLTCNIRKGARIDRASA